MSVTFSFPLWGRDVFERIVRQRVKSAKKAGRTHPSALARMSLLELVKQGVLTEKEKTHLNSLIAVAERNKKDRSKKALLEARSEVQRIHNLLLDEDAGALALTISGIALSSIDTETGSAVPADWGGALAGAVLGGEAGAVGGAIVAGVTGGALGGAIVAGAVGGAIVGAIGGYFTISTVKAQ